MLREVKAEVRKNQTQKLKSLLKEEVAKNTKAADRSGR
jgi:hypothetical protein